ncbi:PepSY domain-containing protein [Methylomonas sp. UP202]|uniref:PepSY domain-containing protein n=1 Tax=Methylomonas sp. UP202 TaxID=3040943 RepID=UPI00247AE627|nr:PepSY domain-containing protein [Methylomonas sp. UP202]WGS87611.1 PepSY domain-containing protein [Methylomonas sp. UP202]
MKKSLNWLLYETHRWLGVVLALFMFVWFATGLVIMYSTPTAQSRAQQLAHAEVLQPESGWLSLGEVWQHSAEQRKAAAEQCKAKPAGGEAASGKPGGEPALADARLLRSAGEPVWLVDDTQGVRYALSAVDGGLRETDRTQALRIAQNWFVAEGRNPAELVYLESVEAPAILRNRETLRPFHRIASNEGDELLISARTGEVLHASSRWERGLFWAGNWIHLFKPLDLLGLGDIRHDVQLWSGAGATIACITGLIIGWLRWRPGFGGKPTYSQGRTQPYREFWFKWHFWTGLIGGTVALSWALSGFVDTNPGKIFSNGEYSKAELKRYLGAEVPATMLDWRPAPLRLAGTGIEVVELNWRRLGGETVLLAQGRDGLRLPLTPSGAGPRFSENAIGDAVQRLAGDTKVAAVKILDDYDSYYYPRHHQGLVEKPLPVVLAELDDAAGSRVYLDPQDGQLLAKLDQSRRVFRWLYSGLHHWDFGWLYYRPLWDIWMLTWVGFGLVLGASSLVIGWKRLVKTFAPKKRRANAAAPSGNAAPSRGATLATEAAD